MLAQAARTYLNRYGRACRTHRRGVHDQRQCLCGRGRPGRRRGADRRRRRGPCERSGPLGAAVRRTWHRRCAWATSSPAPVATAESPAPTSRPTATASPAPERGSAATCCWSPAAGTPPYTCSARRAGDCPTTTRSGRSCPSPRSTASRCRLGRRGLHRGWLPWRNGAGRWRARAVVRLCQRGTGRRPVSPSRVERPAGLWAVRTSGPTPT